jgi:transposase
VQRFGVIVPVVKDQHDRTLDGHHRKRIADDLGVAYPVRVLAVVDDEQAAEVARTLNEDRRHLTPEQRREVVKALRGEGHTQRAIAGAVGVSQATVHRDLDSHESRPTKRRRRRRTTARVERPDFVVFFTTVQETIDVLERFAADPAALAAEMPDRERGAWIDKTRELARHAVQLADGLAALPDPATGVA